MAEFVHEGVPYNSHDTRKGDREACLLRITRAVWEVYRTWAENQGNIVMDWSELHESDRRKMADMLDYFWASNCEPSTWRSFPNAAWSNKVDMQLFLAVTAQELMQKALDPAHVPAASGQGPMSIDAIYRDASNLCEILVGPANYRRDGQYFRVGFVTAQRLEFSTGPGGGESALGHITINQPALDSAQQHFGQDGYGVVLLRRDKDIFIYCQDARLAPAEGKTIVRNGKVATWDEAVLRYRGIISLKPSHELD